MLYEVIFYEFGQLFVVARNKQQARQKAVKKMRAIYRDNLGDATEAYINNSAIAQCNRVA